MKKIILTITISMILIVLAVANIKNNNINANNNVFICLPAQEPELTIEDWMLNSNKFYNNINLNIDKEEDLIVEDWMLNAFN